MDQGHESNGHGQRGGHEGHDEHEGHSVDMFRNLFWGSLFLSLPALIWSQSLQGWLGYAAPAVPFQGAIAPLFGTAVFLYGGRVFLSGARREVSGGQPGMMTLISLAITVALGYSIAVTSGWDGEPLWWELATLVVIMLLGHWIEMRSIRQARGALDELAQLLPDTAERVTDDGTEQVPAADLLAGDVVLVRPGSAIPGDGVVLEGRSGVDESLISGESTPVEKTEGSDVVAGSVNGSGALRIRIDQTGDGTTLAGIMRLVQDAQSSKSRTQALADRAARALFYLAVGAGALTFAAWMISTGDASIAVQRTVAVLVIACPHALGVAIPLVVAISTRLGAANGILVRDRRGLEESRSLDTIAFDKTGTLTMGDFGVVDIVSVEGWTDDEVLGQAAAVERDSEHTIARGIVSAAEERSTEVPRAIGFEAIAGHGAEAIVSGVKVRVGGPALLEKLGVELPTALEDAGRESERRGQTTVYVVQDLDVIGVVGLADRLRPESSDAVARLHSLGLEVVMLTGDARPVAEAVAADLGIETVFAQVLPDQKAERIRQLRSEGRRVAMVGDGVNDAPALATADVGVAIGAGTDVAVESGDIVLVDSDPRDVARMIRLSRATYRKMIQNLWWAAGYNIVALPVAAGALVGWGILLPPALAAVLMSASTVVVAVNAQLLRRVDLAA